MDKIGINKTGRILCLLSILLILSIPVLDTLYAETFYLRGRLASEFQVQITKTLTVPSGVRTLYVQLAAVPSFQSPTFSQEVRSQEHRYSVPPTRTEEKMDPFGNHYQIARWDPAPPAVTVTTSIRLAATVEFPVLQNTIPLPLGDLPSEARRYLDASPAAQKDDGQVQQLARQLTATARTEHDAVTAIIGWVVDHTTYTLQPEAYDAVSTLKTGRGNCQNFSNLSVALLRAVGIPARVVTGFSTKTSWSVRLPNGESYSLGLADGRHAWLEVFFPGLGWLEYDAQQSLTFVSTRYIRQTVGADSRESEDGTYGWSRTAGSEEPTCRETIEVQIDADQATVTSEGRMNRPTNHLFGPLVAALPPTTPAPPVATAVPPAPSPPPQWTREALQQVSFTQSAEFGNLDFPETLDVFGSVDRPAGTTQGVATTRSYVVESAEYVTGPRAFAQLFELRQPLRLTSISLALHRFAGAGGTLWIELADDVDGKPAPDGVISDRLTAPETGIGYRWVAFTFRDQRTQLVLTPGRYWIILHHTGDVIYNWFYIYGNPYGSPDDTRLQEPASSAWATILNYDFNFRVRGFTPR